LLPIYLVLLDELQMPRMYLVSIMVRLGRKDYMQTDVERAVIDGSLQSRFQLSAGEEDRARMAGQVFPASLDEFGS
jgi:hypothetical protein